MASHEIPEYLRKCSGDGCREDAAFSVECRHGKGYPACLRCVGDLLMRAYSYDGDHGQVDVYHLQMYYVTHERSLGDGSRSG
jgi:hypothetical protein